MAFGDIWDVRLQGTAQGQVTLTMLHYFQQGAGSDIATVNTIGDYFNTTFLPIVAAAQADQFHWTNVIIQKIFPVNLVANVRDVDIGGTIDGQMVPLTTSFNTKKKTDFAGRSKRGRAYWPGAAIGRVDPATGRWNNDQLVAMQEICDEMVQLIGVDDFGPHLYLTVYHRFDNGNTKVTRVEPDAVPRVQRRREIGVGI